MAKIRLQVVEKKHLVNDSISFCFKLLEPQTLSYKPGQFLSLVFQLGGREQRRSYSLCSVASLDKTLQIVVKRIENGEISRYLHEQIQQGDTLESRGPNGNFYVDRELLQEKTTLFLFAAGLGITPLYAILKYSLAFVKTLKVVLIYSNKSAEQVLFAKELQELSLLYPDRFTWVNLLSNSKNLQRARLNSFLIHELVEQNLNGSKSTALFYTCGPVDYMDLCRISLLGAGYQPEQIKRETFFLPEDEEDEDDNSEKIIDKNSYTVKLIIAGQTHSLQIDYPNRILDVALTKQIPIPYSCSGGVCGTCVGTCVSGGVKMDYNEVLTDDELAKGRVLICTGRPTSNDTVITWD